MSDARQEMMTRIGSQGRSSANYIDLVDEIHRQNAELLAALEWIAEDDGGRAGECARVAIATAKDIPSTHLTPD